MWTLFKDYQSKLRGKGYSKEFKTEQLKEIDNAYGFLACNAGATNKYAGCYNLAYCVNIYLHPAISQFFYQKGIKVDEDLYGLRNICGIDVGLIEKSIPVYQKEMVKCCGMALAGGLVYLLADSLSKEWE